METNEKYRPSISMMPIMGETELGGVVSTIGSGPVRLMSSGRV